MDITVPTNIPLPTQSSYRHKSPLVKGNEGAKASFEYADSRLVIWARWAKTYPERLGYPNLSLIYKVLRRHAKRLGTVHRPLELRGLTARGTETRSMRPLTVGEPPLEVIEIDHIVAQLKLKHKEVIRTEYLSEEVVCEVKAARLRMYPTEYRDTLRQAKRTVAKALSALPLMDTGYS